MYIAPIIVGLAAFLIPYLLQYLLKYSEEKGKNKAHKEDEKELVQIKEDARHVQEIKRNAIIKSLNFIDDYFSWLDWTDPPQKPVRKNLTNVELTEIARNCYNELVLSCHKETVNQFLKIIFDDDNKLRQKGSSPTHEYNLFRNFARKELGLEKIELDEDKVFIAKVSTNALEAP